MSCGGAISFDISQAGTSIFCLHCGQKVQLKSDSATPPEPSQSPPPPAINDTPKEIFLSIGDQMQGPHSEATLSDYLKAGQVAPDALAWHEGAEGWKPLSEVLGAAAQNPPATPPSPPAGGIPKRTMAGAAPAEEKPEDSEGGDPDQIRVTRKGEPIGPYSREKAKEYFASGQLLPTDWGWHDGMDDWKPLYEVLGMAAPTALAPECPNGHGETREWSGRWRCWECGWQEGGPSEKHSSEGEEYHEEDYHETKSSGLRDLLIVVACLSLSVVCFHYVFFAEGSAEKKEMADLKQRLETVVLPAEGNFFRKIATFTDSGGFRPGALYYIDFEADVLLLRLDGPGGWGGMTDLELYKSDKVRKLMNKYRAYAGFHIIDWKVWKDLHGSRGFNKRKLDTDILEKLRVWKRERKVALDELDKAFRENGLGPLKGVKWDF
jgi:hypothetical protein